MAAPKEVMSFSIDAKTMPGDLRHIESLVTNFVSNLVTKLKPATRALEKIMGASPSPAFLTLNEPLMSADGKRQVGEAKVRARVAPVEERLRHQNSRVALFQKAIGEAARIATIDPFAASALRGSLGKFSAEYMKGPSGWDEGVLGQLQESLHHQLGLSKDDAARVKRARAETAQGVRRANKGRGDTGKASHAADQLQKMVNDVTAAGGTVPPGIAAAISEMRANPGELSNIKGAYAGDIAALTTASATVRGEKVVVQRHKNDLLRKRATDAKLDIVPPLPGAVDPKTGKPIVASETQAAFVGLGVAQKNWESAMASGKGIGVAAVDLRKATELAEKQVKAAEKRIEASKRDSDVLRQTDRLSRIFVTQNAIQQFGTFAGQVLTASAGNAGGLTLGAGSAFSGAGSQLAMGAYLRNGSKAAFGAFAGLSAVEAGFDVMSKFYDRGAGAVEKATSRATTSDTVIGRALLGTNTEQRMMGAAGWMNENVTLDMSGPMGRRSAQSHRGMFTRGFKPDDLAGTARNYADDYYREQRRAYSEVLGAYLPEEAWDKSMDTFASQSGGDMSKVRSSDPRFRGNNAVNTLHPRLQRTAQGIRLAMAHGFDPSALSGMFANQFMGRTRNGADLDVGRGFMGLTHSLGLRGDLAQSFMSNITNTLGGSSVLQPDMQSEMRFMAGMRGGVAPGRLQGFMQSSVRSGESAHDMMFGGYKGLMGQASFLKSLSMANGDFNKAGDINAKMTTEERVAASREYFGDQLTQLSFRGESGLMSGEARAAMLARGQDPDSPLAVDPTGQNRLRDEGRHAADRTVYETSQERQEKLRAMDARMENASVSFKKAVDQFSESFWHRLR